MQFNYVEDRKEFKKNSSRRINVLNISRKGTRTVYRY